VFLGIVAQRAAQKQKKKRHTMYTIDECDLPYQQFHNNKTMAIWIESVRRNSTPVNGIDEQMRNIQIGSKKHKPRPLSDLLISHRSKS